MWSILRSAMIALNQFNTHSFIFEVVVERPDWVVSRSGKDIDLDAWM